MTFDGKELSAAALLDEKDYLARVAKDLTANKPPRRSAAPPPISKYVTEDALGPLLEKIGRAIAAELKPLRRRIAELEARPEFDYTGTWTRGKAYRKGQGCTHAGSIFIAMRDCPGAPGTPDCGWRLACKRGRDGRDAK